MNPSVGFPMEMDNFPGRLWVVSHKPVAVEAGLGRMGIHRNVIHPRFGNFIVLGTILWTQRRRRTIGRLTTTRVSSASSAWQRVPLERSLRMAIFSSRVA